MKHLSSLVSLVFARFGQALRSLRELPQGWRPQHAPVLVPIPIRAEQRARLAARRLRQHGG